jgi:hypothetical protein
LEGQGGAGEGGDGAEEGLVGMHFLVGVDRNRPVDNCRLVVWRSKMVIASRLGCSTEREWLASKVEGQQH